MLVLLAEFLARFEALGLHLHEVAARDAFALARELGLSGHDARYLWLARALGIELVTLDRQLDRAAVAIL